MEVRKVVNATPHPLTLVVGEEKVTIPPSGLLVRVATEERPVGELAVEGVIVPVVRQTLKDLVVTTKDGEVLPAEQARAELEGAAVIVSAVALPYAEELKKKYGAALVLAPNTAKALRDEQGRIIGVPSLVLGG